MNLVNLIREKLKPEYLVIIDYKDRETLKCFHDSYIVDDKFIAVKQAVNDLHEICKHPDIINSEIYEI